MGRVFSYEEVANNQVPWSSDFSVTAEIFDANSMMAIESQALVGSVVYGSAAIERTSRRSDFDCMLITDGSVKSLEVARRIVLDTSSATSGRVDISPIAYPRDTLASGRHEIDRFFGQHLTGSGRVVRGEDVADFINYDNLDALTIFNDYARNKKRRLASAYVASNEAELLKGLQRLTELPLAIGRKLVRVVEETQGIEPAVINTAEKQLVRVQAMRVFGELWLEDTAKTLLFNDRDYSGVLHEALAGDIEKAEYNAMLDHMHQLIPQAIDWLDALDKTLPVYLADTV